MTKNVLQYKKVFSILTFYNVIYSWDGKSE